MRSRVLSAVAATLTLAANAPAQSGSMSGVVYDRATQKPIPDVSVVIAGMMTGVMTKANGSYLLLGIPAGTHTIELKRADYETQRVTGIVIQDNVRRTQDFHLEWGRETPRPLVERGVVGATAATLPSPATPRPPGGAGMTASIESWLFPPDLVMQHQRALNLSADQRRIITDAVKALQNQMVDLQWNLQAEQQALITILERRPINEQAATTQLSKVVDLEDSVKRTHLQMLVRIRNALTEEQVEQLNVLRHRREEPTPSPDPVHR